MSPNPISTAPSPTRFASQPTPATPSPRWPTIGADALVAVREPAGWLAAPGPVRAARQLAPVFRLGLIGVVPDAWTPPGWLLPHQAAAAHRLAPALRVFGGALLCDAAGLGKSFVALALATRYPSATMVVPAALRPQWRELATGLGLTPRLVSHEALSRGARLPATALLVVDEAHRFRNPATRRYDTLARQVGRADVLLVTATPVVNRAADITHLMRLFLADHALAALGVPSLDSAAEGSLEALLHAIAPLTMARSPDAAGPVPPLPSLRGHRIIRAAPAEPAVLAALIRAVARLRFPSFGPDAAPLLRRHLLARLASSPEACRESVRRHRAYLVRARDAAHRGERLSRAAARSLFGADDAGQLAFALETASWRGGPSVAAFERELERLDALAATLRPAPTSPKTRACAALLRRRGDAKTIVFTGARATARSLADAMSWRRVAVVAGRRAEIASGRLSVADAFGLFAPRSQGRRAPSPLLRLDTLIATDVAAEGLNLQDADGIVHFDLPWTPLALEQRTGRARRLGSRHRAVQVWWFAPPAALERRLGVTARIDRKASVQVALGAARTAAVGRVTVTGGALDRREALALERYAMVQGHAWSTTVHTPLAVVRWRGARGAVYQVLARDSAGLPVDQVAGLGNDERAWAIGERAADLAWLLLRLRRLTAAADAAPGHAAGRHLRRRILARARAAARERRFPLLHALDQALQLALPGLPVGGERQLSDIVEGADSHALDAWARRWRVHAPLADPSVVALVEPAKANELTPYPDSVAAVASSGYIRVHGASRPRPGTRACEARRCRKTS